MVWVAQTDSRAETLVDGAQFCLDHGASACFLHGGVMDHCVAQGRWDELRAFAQAVRDAQVPVGLAGHQPADFRWAEAHLPVDFYMVCYYNPADRALVPHHDPEATEHYAPEDRQARVATLATLSKPAIHYKILAAGRLGPQEAFAYAADHMRPCDAVCVGIYTQDDRRMLATDIELLLQGLGRVGQL